VHGTDKKRKLKVDANGYYECTLGAFNIYNSSGEYYPALESVKEMFSPGGSLRRRLDNGTCRGELDHPSPAQCKNLMDFIKRVLTIQPDRVSHHIASVTLNETRDDKGNNIVLCTGRLKPSGPYASTLQASLENVEENVAFSIRSLTNDKTLNGRKEKHIQTIVTWDYVNEPGISLANKFQTPTLESLDSEVVILEDMLSDIAREKSPLGMESARAAAMVLTDLGWHKVEVINPNLAYLNW
jgi:hypothetical protein